MVPLPSAKHGSSYKAQAVFLDRDGVLIADEGLVTTESQLNVLPGVPQALTDLHEAGFKLVVVSNQAVVARGLLTEAQMTALHRILETRLGALGGPPLDGFYYCPHHPNATLESYRLVCHCRKPEPGLLLRASRELDIDPSASFMVGDRPTDLLAGTRAGCRTIWVQTGQHLAEPIQTSRLSQEQPKADFVCDDLRRAAAWILEVR